MRNFGIVTILSALVFFGASMLSAQTSAPQLIKVQGYLTQSGSPANGTFSMSFTIYDSQFPGGTAIASVGPQSVTVASGLYDVDLPIASGAFNGSSRYLEITVNSEVLTPRMQLMSAPFAFEAEKLDGLEGTDFVKRAGDAMSGNLQVAGTVQSTLGGFKFPDGTVQTTAAPAAAGGGTLDQAYNSGGAGAGRTINANSGAVNVAGTSGLTVNGNLGVGTTAPGAKMDVRGSGLFDNQVITIGSKSGLSNERLSILYDGTVARARVTTAAGVGLGIGPAGDPDRLFLSSAGNLGIGTTSPAGPLHIQGSQAWERLVSTSTTNGSVIELWNYTPAPPPLGSTILGAINFGNGSTTPGQISYVKGYNGGIGSGLAFRSGNQTRMNILEDGTVRVDGPIEGKSTSGNAVTGTTTSGYALVGQSNGAGWGALFRYGTDGNNSAYLGGNGSAAVFYGPVGVNGTTTTRVLQITGGSDIAEPFTLSSDDVPDGALVTIDEAHPGELKMSDRSYDTRVAGIVSGANGIKPGLTLHQEGALTGNRNVALSGRVYALADASYGSIRPGDLLTTSDTPGHCMKATNTAQAPGAIIGKAMGSLDRGTGMVLVLVSLQ